ncbi:hypothetical protein PVAG01_02873 [Phlyctema vagabunda]|uniref:Uncharacterized protein n=1 Tax=Phlyctema vagabunda TaxID=108571 RepID=A0ABR4PSD9_9HELO
MPSSSHEEGRAPSTDPLRPRKRAFVEQSDDSDQLSVPAHKRACHPVSPKSESWSQIEDWLSGIEPGTSEDPRCSSDDALALPEDALNSPSSDEDTSEVSISAPSATPSGSFIYRMRQRQKSKNIEVTMLNEEQPPLHVEEIMGQIMSTPIVSATGSHNSNGDIPEPTTHWYEQRNRILRMAEDGLKHRFFRQLWNLFIGDLIYLPSFSGTMPYSGSIKDILPRGSTIKPKLGYSIGYDCCGISYFTYRMLEYVCLEANTVMFPFLFCCLGQGGGLADIQVWETAFTLLQSQLKLKCLGKTLKHMKGRGDIDGLTAQLSKSPFEMDPCGRSCIDNPAVFSIQLGIGSWELYAHYVDEIKEPVTEEPRPYYRTVNIKRLCLADEEQCVEARAITLRILKWGLGQRRTDIVEYLNDLATNIWLPKICKPR